MTKAVTPEKVFAAELAAGEVPSPRTIKAKMRVGAPRAQVIRDRLAGAMQEQPRAA